MIRTGEKPWFDDQCVMASRTKQREYRVWLIERSIWWLVVILSMCMWKLNEHSMSGAEHS